MQLIESLLRTQELEKEMDKCAKKFHISDSKTNHMKMRLLRFDLDPVIFFSYLLDK